MFEPMRRAMAVVAIVAATAGAADAEERATLSPEEVDRFAQLALDCVYREYPNKITHVLESDADAAPPRKLTPVFHGCYDWHSAVHAHWLLARLARLYPEAGFASAGRAALGASFTADKVKGEIEYLEAEGRASFERPYGLAWFLQLTAELREWDDADARAWVQVLAPIEDVVEARFMSWLPNLVYPVRSGTHNQTAFGFALALDWARVAGRDELAALLTGKSLEFHAGDRACPLAYEPSGEDFLSPCLMEADLMRRVIPAREYPAWLARFLPDIPEDGSAGWIEPGVVRDPTDGKLVHLDGFNLSRAWNLQGIVASLPPSDPRRGALLAAGAEHRESGLAAVTGEHYEGGHWLASFATYLVTDKVLEAGSLAEKSVGAPRVMLETEQGDITVEVYPDAAPASAGDFLAYVEQGLYDGATFYRAVHYGNDHGEPKIEVLQGGLADSIPALPPVEHETTRETGLLHTTGALSLARGDVGTGSAAAFFIVLSDQPGLDHGGMRNPDGQGFAVFGRVVEGMEVVRRIHALPTDENAGDEYVRGQLLAEPVVIRRARPDQDFKP